MLAAAAAYARAERAERNAAATALAALLEGDAVVALAATSRTRRFTDTVVAAADLAVRASDVAKAAALSAAGHMPFDDRLRSTLRLDVFGIEDVAREPGERIDSA